MSVNDFAGPAAAVLRAISDPGSMLDRLRRPDGGLEPLPEWQTRAVLEAAAPIIAAAERKRLADRAAMTDEVRHELDDAFQFTKSDGVSRHSYVSREWVEALLTAEAASAGAAECERIRQLALAEAARIGASDFSNADVIASGALDDFAALIGETP